MTADPRRESPPRSGYRWLTAALLGGTIAGIAPLAALGLMGIPNVSPPGGAPWVFLGPPDSSAAFTWFIQVVEVSREEPLSSFAVQVIVETEVTIPATDLDVVRDGDVMIGDLGLHFVSGFGSRYDVLDDRGDYFTIRGIQPAVNYELQLIWKETGDVLDSATFLG